MEKQTKRINKLILDRRQILQHFPQGLKIAEIGVLRGKYSRKIAETQPEELFLIDCWQHIEGDNVYAIHDGCNVEDSDHEKRYQSVKKLFAKNSAVRMIRKLSGDAVGDFADNYLDAVYIDGDHSYGGCLADLRSYSKKVKPTGFMWGHDYTTSYKWIQVIQAIETFLAESPEWQLVCITGEVPKKSPSWFLARKDSILHTMLDGLDVNTVNLQYKTLSL